MRKRSRRSEQFRRAGAPLSEQEQQWLEKVKQVDPASLPDIVAGNYQTKHTTRILNITDIVAPMSRAIHNRV